MTDCRAFVTKSNGFMNRLVNNVIILFNEKQIEIQGLWDTGATNSCISMEVVERLELIKTGFSDVKTPSGQSRRNTYLIDVALPNHVIVKDVRVNDSEIGKQGLGILIGMDIIRLGDFAVSNYNGKTVFTFRHPSQKCIDFVTPINIQNIIGKKHGSGKKKR